MNGAIPLRREPIAIVGLACRFPGAPNANAFWRLLVEGRDAITEVPGDRFDIDTLYAATPATPGRVMSRWGGFLPGIDQFDAAHFGLAPREAERLDPQQRLLLELTTEALDDAGDLGSAGRRRTGVFVGMWLSDYESRLFRDPSAIDFYMTTGSGRYAASGRLSHCFDLGGPSLTVDTACSSSLVAVHLACQSLRDGDCEAAIVGAANVILEPSVTIAYSQARMMAPDGRCKFGDAEADGYVRSDGAAVLVLKTLSRAMADGDRIYGTVLGSSVNNDGEASGSVGRPSATGQEEMIRRAYAAAGVRPSAVDYVEAHGTGTRAGDPVELKAIGAVVAEGRDTASPCRVGSVKTNIGHTEGAAGLAGLIKVVLSLQHGQLPPSLHFRVPSPKIPWNELPLAMQKTLAPWPRRQATRIAGVNSFGIGGTNAHVVVGDAPESAARELEGDQSSGPFVIGVSARDGAALKTAAGQLATQLAEDTVAGLHDVSYTTMVRRRAREQRGVVVAFTCAEVVAALGSLQRGEPNPLVTVGSAQIDHQRKVVFVFPGQGSQWVGMGRQLLNRNVAFADELRRCDAAIRELTGWSVIAALDASAPEWTIDVIQPALFAIEVSLAAAWRSAGVRPDAVIGHSMGEIAAAYVAGALSLADAARVICRRSQLLRGASGKGAMAVVELSLAEAETALAAYQDRVGVAVSNSMRSTVLSGDPDAIDEILADCERREIFARRVKVDVASHSPQMDSLRDDLLREIDGITPRHGALPLYSTVSGRVETGACVTPSYWADNLRQPVRFATMVTELLHDGFDTFVEMSPHPLLTGAIAELASETTVRTPLVIGSGRRDGDDYAAWLTALANAHCHGFDVDWAAVVPAGGRVISLPSVLWQRERFWYDGVAPLRERVSDRGSLLGDAVQPEAEPGVTYWQFDLSVDAFPFLADHRVRGTIVVPAALFIDLMLDVAGRDDATRTVALAELVVDQALVLGPRERRRVQLVAAGGPAAGRTIRVLSQDAQEERWVEHARARVASINPPLVDRHPFDADAGVFDAATHYAAMTRRGLDYGPAFQRLSGGRLSGTDLVATLTIAGTVEKSGGWQQRTQLLDACLQAAVAALPPDEGRTFVPVSAALVYAAFPIHGVLTCRVQPHAAPASPTEALFDLSVTDGDGRVVASISGLGLRAIGRKAMSALDLQYHLAWQRADAVGSSGTSAGNWLICGHDVSGSALAAALAAHGAAPTVATVSEAVERLAAASSAQWRGVVYITTPADPAAEELPKQAERNFLDALALCQAVVTPDEGQTRVWLLTHGSVSVAGTDGDHDPAGATSWGLRSVAASEYPRLRISCVDCLKGGAGLEAVATELLSDGAEDEIAFRSEGRFVRRLQHGLEAAAAVSTPARQRPYRVVASTSSIDALVLEQFTPPQPGPLDVLIEVSVAGLNFMNVMSALGVYPGYENGRGPLGIECAGRVVRVGQAVSRFKAGDAVMAFAHDSMATHAIANERLVAAIPSGLTDDEAATLPIAYLTAHYALVHLARVRRGERVLVHSAAGGVGLAAIAVARRLGAEIIATAGSDAKRAHLQAMGIVCVGDSRSLDFVGTVEQATGGEGVDVVLNSLAGAAVSGGLSLLRSGGRFVELGKRDIYDNRSLGLLPFQRNLSFAAVDLDRFARERPALLGEILDEVVTAIRDGHYRPLPVAGYSTSDVASAFRDMAAGQHIGKIIVRVERETALVRPPQSACPEWSRGVHLIVGGTGGLGLAIAAWMIGQGARRLVLTGRRPEDGALSARLAPLRASAGVSIDVVAADVSVKADVTRLFAHLDALTKPLSGVVQAAGMLSDATVADLVPAQVRDVFAPKVTGAVHLDQATRGRALDYFVLFSSVASFLGLSGQANYAAANAVLDALAAERRAAGLPGIAIGWGPWAEVGLAAQRDDRGGRLAERGLDSLSPGDGAAAFGDVLNANPVHAVVMRFDARRWSERNPASRAQPLLADVTAVPDLPNMPSALGEAATALLDEYASAVLPAERYPILVRHVRSLVGQVLRLPADRVDDSRPLRTMGLDSLMGLELRNRLEAVTGLKLPATLIWNYPTVTALATQLGERLAERLDNVRATMVSPSPTVAAAGDDELEPLLAELEGLSDEEARRLLAGDRRFAHE